MQKSVCRALCAALVAFAMPAACAAKDSVKIVQTPPSTGANSFYVGNRAPLLPNPLIKLPVGSVKPAGWLRTQLELEADGFSGHLTEISGWCKFDGNSWVSPTGVGHSPWEEMPYWLKGFTDLGYVLGDKRITDEAQKWINAILDGQRPDGYLGPEENRKKSDIWPNMLALYALRSHYEATGDKRVIKAMTAYFRWLNDQPIEKLLPGSWQKVRGGDNLDSIYWLYNQTGDQWLLDLAKKNHERTADWTRGVANWHGVNFAQCFREPAEYYQQSKDETHLKATERDFDTMIGIYGQVPGGLYGADENARERFTGPRQGTESCTMAEMMFSDEMLTGITGDPKWADHCETVAFNSLPCSMAPDLKGLHYLTAPNEPLIDRRNKAPGYQNGGDMQSYNPYEYRCCQHNMAMAWPYMNDHLWMATRDNGIAAVLYAPSEVKAKVGKGTQVRITEATSYPFDETITFTVSTTEPVAFPLTLRLPAWCKSPKIKVNSAALPIPAGSKGWAVIDRTWKAGDKIILTLPMAVDVKTWAKNKDSVSVYYGPLAYSLKIGEEWKSYKTPSDKWPAYEVLPTTPWNYGLIIDSKNPAKSFKVVKKKGAITGQPFTPDNAPITIIASGKKIPEWQLDKNGLVAEVEQSPVKSTEPAEQITLIPMGCARLRISAFPQIGEGPDAKAWAEK